METFLPTKSEWKFNLQFESDVVPIKMERLGYSFARDLQVCRDALNCRLNYNLRKTHKSVGQEENSH